MPIAGVSAEQHGPGTLPADWRVGDYLLVSAGVYNDGVRGPVPLLSRLIQSAQARRFRGERRPYAHWNHAVWVSSECLIEAVGSGVVCSPFDKYRDVEFAYVHSNLTDAEREDADQFVRYLVGSKTPYGVPTIVSIALSLLTGLTITFARQDTVICSGLVAAALAAHDWRADPTHVMPADLAEYARLTPADVHKPTASASVAQEGATLDLTTVDNEGELRRRTSALRVPPDN